MSNGKVSERLAVIRVAGGTLRFARIKNARRPDQLEQHILGVATQGVGDLGDKGLDREGVRDVADRAEPANPRVRFGLAGLAAQIGDRERHVDDTLAQLTRLLSFRVGNKNRADHRRHDAVPPGDDMPLAVDTGIEAFE